MAYELLSLIEATIEERFELEHMYVFHSSYAEFERYSDQNFDTSIFWRWIIWRLLYVNATGTLLNALEN